MELDYSIQDMLLNDSRIAPAGNGSKNKTNYPTQPTGGQKWWAAVLLGFIFAIVSSPAAYELTSRITHINSAEAGTSHDIGITLKKLIIQTLIFIVIMRLILW